MAHNLNIDENGKASFAAVGEKAWHGLGQYVQEAMTAAQAIELGGLDYTVEKQPLTVQGTDILIPNYQATVLKDIFLRMMKIPVNKEIMHFPDSISLPTALKMVS